LGLVFRIIEKEVSPDGAVRIEVRSLLAHIVNHLPIEKEVSSQNIEVRSLLAHIVTKTSPPGLLSRGEEVTYFQNLSLCYPFDLLVNFKVAKVGLIINLKS
jgi:hypothetical protein